MQFFLSIFLAFANISSGGPSPADPKWPEAPDMLLVSDLWKVGREVSSPYGVSHTVAYSSGAGNTAYTAVLSVLPKGRNIPSHVEERTGLRYILSGKLVRVNGRPGESTSKGDLLFRGSGGTAPDVSVMEDALVIGFYSPRRDASGWTNQTLRLPEPKQPGRMGETWELAKSASMVVELVKTPRLTRRSAHPAVLLHLAGAAALSVGKEPRALSPPAMVRIPAGAELALSAGKGPEPVQLLITLLEHPAWQPSKP